jgi:hypothetical protein
MNIIKLKDMFDTTDFIPIPRGCDLDVMIQKNNTLTLQNQKLSNAVIGLIGITIAATVVAVIIYLQSLEDKKRFKVVI